MKNPTLLGTLFLLMPAWAGAAPATIPACAAKAAADYNLPPKVFAALVIQARTQSPQIDRRSGKSGEFGPMKLTQKAINIAAPEIGQDVEAIKQNACANYRAAAWWLAGPSEPKHNKDVWSMVNRYFYKTRDNAKGFAMVNEVKMIHAKL